MSRASTFIALFTLMIGQQTFASDKLCPNRAPLQEGADDLRMQEDEFTEVRAMESVKFLQTDFSKKIWGANAVKDLSAWSGHYIGYANSLKIIEGTLLKQQVRLYRTQLNELAMTAPESSEIPNIKNKLGAAINSFCAFIDKVEYVD